MSVPGLALSTMSEEQLSALLARLKADMGLQEKLKGAADLDAFMAIAKGAGFDVTEEEWLKHQKKQTDELSDEELEGVAGGCYDPDDIEQRMEDYAFNYIEKL